MNSESNEEGKEKKSIRSICSKLS